MIAAVRSEFLKFFSTRMWWGMAIAIVLAAVAFTTAFGFLYTQDFSGAQGEGAPVGGPVQIANSVYTGGLGLGYLLTLTIGVMQIGSEYRHKTITSTFLATPRRGRVMLAKVFALLGLGALYGLLSVTASVVVGALILNARGFEPFPSDEVFRTLALSLLVLGLWALIGLGAGILIPNQVAALLVSVGVAWIVEPIASVALAFWTWGADHIRPYLPSGATEAIVNGVSQGPATYRLEWWGGALVLAAYAVVLAGIGSWRTTRSDIS